MRLSAPWNIALWLFLFCEITMAQVTMGTISGTVRDGTGAVLAGARVEVRNEETGIFRVLETEANGHYSALSLSLGNYRVTGRENGFQTEIRKGIVLTVGREVIVDLTLAVGSVTQTMEVTEGVPLVESTTASLGSLVDEHTIRALPLNGRSYDQLALLQPGVILTSPGPITASPYVFGTGKRFSVGGQRSDSNLFLLDGTDINDQGNGTPGGAAGTNLGVDTIREFKIFTNSYKAEFGHSTGSVITAVTRSGTNAIHGTAFEYIRNSVLDAMNYFDNGHSPPPFRRNQFGGAIGGPIKKNRTFFFGGYEGLRQGLDNTQIATVPTLLARQGILPTGTVAVNPMVVPYLNLYPLPNGTDFGDGTAQYVSAPSIVTNEDNFMVRVDHQLNAKTGIFARYSFDNDQLDAPLSLLSQEQVSATRRQYTTLQANSIFGVKALNSFRFAYNRTFSTNVQNTTPPAPAQLSFVPGQPIGTINVGAPVFSGTRPITAFGSNLGTGILRWAYNIFQVADDFTYVSGKHSLKVGANIERLQDNTFFTSGLRGSYTFASFTNFLMGKPSNFQTSSPLGVPAFWALRQSIYGFYGQDDYSVNSRLTLNLGLRWETSTDPVDANGKMSILPSPAATQLVPSDNYFSITKKNFEPRLGLAWRINESGKTVLRLGGGIYHNQILPEAYFSQIRTPPYFGTFSVSNPVFPNASQTLTAGGPLALLLMAPVEKTPVDDQYNLSIQQQLSANTVFEVAYAGNHANHVPTQSETDTAIPITCSTSLNNCPAGLADGTTYYPAGGQRRNPAFNGIRIVEMNGTSIYNSVTVKLRRQTSGGFQGQIFYTFSKATDNSSGDSNGLGVRSPTSLLYPSNISRDWGLSDFDARHSAVASFTAPVPFRTQSKALAAVISGWTIDGIGTFTSGMPFTARLSSAVSRDLSTALSERPNLNSGFSSNPTHGTSAGCSGIAAGTQLSTPRMWFDPCAFSLPVAGTYGNLGRNSIIGPGLADLDLALAKTFSLHEGINATFRAEAFNILNHPNFGLPNTSALTSAGAPNPSAGVITYTATTSRQLQFALRISF